MRVIHIIIIWFISAALACSLLFGFLYLYAGRDTVPQGVTIAGLDIGGIHWQEAAELVDQVLLNFEEQTVLLSIGPEKVTLSWREIGVTYDASHFHQELRRLHEGHIVQRALARLQFPTHWELNVKFDDSKLQRLFNPAWEASHFGNPVNAVRLISNTDTVSYLPGHSVKRIDWHTFLGSLERFIQHNAPGRLDIQNLRRPAPSQLIPSLPVPSPFSQTPPGPPPSVALSIPLYTLQPAVTLEKLQSQGIRRKLIAFSTPLLNSSEGRLHNITAAAQALDGMLIAPEQIFDYSKIVQEAQQKYGFREAPVIYAGKLVPGIGGGICQVSSTLYNAVIRIGLDIVERRNHSLPVSYASLGQDATFAQGHINFRFKNSTSHHLLIHTEIDEEHLTVKIFGDIPGNVTYDIQSKIIKELSPPSKLVLNPTLAHGASQIVLEGQSGFIVETYRTKKIAGKPVETVKLSRDTYPAQPTVIAVNDPSLPSDEYDQLEAPKEKQAPGTLPKSETPDRLLEDGIVGPRFR